MQGVDGRWRQDAGDGGGTAQVESQEGRDEKQAGGATGRAGLSDASLPPAHSNWAPRIQVAKTHGIRF